MKKNRLSFALIIVGFIGFAQESPTAFSLQEAIDYTLKNNYDVLNAEFALKKAEKQVWEATATGLPQINGTANYTHNLEIPKAVFGGQEFTMGTPQTASIGVTTTQLLFSGAYLVGLQSAKAFKKISDLSVQKTKSTLTEAIINAYAGVIIADENLKILNKNVTVAEKNYHDISETYKVGLVEEQSVEQLSYTLTQLKTSRNVAQRQRESAINSLKFLMGLQQNVNLTLTSTLDDVVQGNLILVENKTINTDIKNHIDYKIADNQVITSALQVKYQKTQALPTLSTSFGYQRNGFSSSTRLSQDFGIFFPSTVWMLNLNIPIFSSGARSSKTQQAKLDLETAKNNKRKIEQQLLQDVKNTQLAYKNAMENYYTSKDLVVLSQRIYNKENIKFVEGLTSSTNLTTVETQLYNAQNQYIQAIYSVIQSKTALDQALGKY